MPPASWMAMVLAAVMALAVDRLAANRGFDPPGFRDPGRRLLASVSLAFIFFLGVFFPAMTFSQPRDIDLESLGVSQLFVAPLLLVGWLAAWYVLGFVAVAGAPEPPPAAWTIQLGLRARDIGAELAIGLGVGLLAWLAVLLSALALGLALSASGGEELLAAEPAALIVWMAGLPVALRLAISLTAGVVEEIFFRGFLQPRVGVTLSTMLFVAAHLGYGQPLMLLGITVLSLFYAGLARWRGNVWAAMAAHFLFDAVQLLVVIPSVLRVYESGAFDGVA